MKDINAEKAKIEPIVKEHMDRIYEISTEACKENGVSSLIVCCYTDMLDKGAYLGGVTMAFRGSTQNRFEMLYQLVKECYDRLVDETQEKYAQMLWNSFSKQVIKREDHFNFGMGEFAEELLKMLSERDKDTEDSDENNE